MMVACHTTTSNCSVKFVKSVENFVRPHTCKTPCSHAMKVWRLFDIFSPLICKIKASHVACTMLQCDNSTTLVALYSAPPSSTFKHL